MIQEKIIAYIEQHLAGQDLDEAIELDEDLLGGGIVDSLGMMKLIAFIEEEFNCKVEPEDMVIENFMTVGHMTHFLQTKLH